MTESLIVPLNLRKRDSYHSDDNVKQIQYSVYSQRFLR